ncbi:DUF1766-domain-containing protein [Aureobasidium pullulans EXF-150]|uniref:DUF1766-domain-containing protein n=1 Tax=Aureobasidium pullulans EXF-150 TaxID=1043002 RepID=A0A074XFT7_AURPU|nr:DUF1766-domain-containing protein [Aureobasidium pullulans EXF-150]KEQ84263.1 DUF1766-domain-containing protein [Aureobasidium pullulans EXF-150]
MSFQNRTPESLVQRSDSKNPATTCRGITSGGKPCRRSLASSPKASPKSSPTAARHSASRGVVAVLEDDQGNLDAAAFYCWQHKAQAQSFTKDNTTSPQAANPKLIPVQERTSIDSLVARLGVASIQDQPKPPRNPREERRRPTQHAQQQYSRTDERPSARPQAHKKPKPKQGFWASLCCAGTADDDEDAPQPSYQPRPQKPQPETTQLLPYIPGHLPPQTTSLLLTELSKPISPHDEAGYIYIFWLTETSSTPSNDTAASLLAPPRPTSRRPSDVMNAYSGNTGTTKTIKLKIGRANNVHRRMNEWNRQCGYSLSLVRFYPYISSSSSPSASPSRPTPNSRTPSDNQVHKVPHAHRVERLVHLELGDKRIKRDCKACGREHKEWFEIEATADGVSKVDEVVRRWVRWAEENP